MVNLVSPTQFVILSQPRSGTTLLQTLLKSHPDIKCDGELFDPNQKHKYSWLIPYLSYFPYPYIFRQAQKSTRPVYGFRLMTSQVISLHTTLQVLSWFGWKIIYINRQNMLTQTLSDLVAQQTKRWHRRTGESPEEIRVRINETDLRGEFQKRHQWLAQEAKALRDLSPLRLCYEDHLQQPTARFQTLERVFDFLGVRSYPVDSDLQPTYAEAYSRIIENYDDLIERVVRPEYGEAAEAWLRDTR